MLLASDLISGKVIYRSTEALKMSVRHYLVYEMLYVAVTWLLFINMIMQLV